MLAEDSTVSQHYVSTEGSSVSQHCVPAEDSTISQHCMCTEDSTVPQQQRLLAFRRCVHRASYCNVYISRPSRYTDSYND